LIYYLDSFLFPLITFKELQNKSPVLFFSMCKHILTFKSNSISKHVCLGLILISSLNLDLNLYLNVNLDLKLDLKLNLSLNCTRYPNLDFNIDVNLPFINTLECDIHDTKTGRKQQTFYSYIQSVTTTHKYSMNIHVTFYS
jgi:hypothetical protein